MGLKYTWWRLLFGYLIVDFWLLNLSKNRGTATLKVAVILVKPLKKISEGSQGRGFILWKLQALRLQI